MNQFRPVRMIARTTPGTHNKRISAKTVTNRLREIDERLPYTMIMIYMRRFFFGLVYSALIPDRGSFFYCSLTHLYFTRPVFVLFIELPSCY